MHLLWSIRTHRIDAKVYQVLEHLEIGRTGIKRMPALELNGSILFQGTPLSEMLLDDVCKRLANAKEKRCNNANQNGFKSAEK